MTIRNIHIENKIIWIVGCIIASIILIASLIWIFNTSIIEINTKNGSSSGEYKYNFLNQIDSKLQTTNSKSPNSEYWMQASTYEVLARQDYKSYLSIIYTNGFFSRSLIEATLKPENRREFVGNNPQQCMSYVREVLVTLECGGLLANAQVHMPATKNLPTFTTTTRGQGPAGYDEGIFQTKDGSFALSHIPNSSENGQTHLLNKLGDNFKSVDVINITNNNLNRSSRYKSVPYKGGFIAYNSNFTEVMYFPGFINQAENIANTNPQNANNPISLDVKNETILTSYQGNNNSLIYLKNNKNLEAYTVNTAYNQISFCGEKYFCMLKDSKLDIYELVNKKFNYLFSVLNVKALHQTNSALLLVNDFGIINLNIPQKNGYLAYSFGDYKYNSSIKTTDNSRLVVNITNPNSSKVALLINPLEENSDNIDKKVVGIENNKDIKTFSIYKNYITVVPNIPADFNTSNNTFDSAKVSQFNQEIISYIKSTGIDLSKYDLHFTIK